MMTIAADLSEAGARTGLAVVAHPDDETIGMVSLLAHLGACHLLHITDGAPREPMFWTHAKPSSTASTRAEYAEVRQDELAAALRLVGITPDRATCLGVVDQEAVFALPAIAHDLAHAMAVIEPDFVITHAYEGGHPDHDAVAFAVWAATRLLDRKRIQPPRIYEMALYHGAAGRMEIGCFVARRDAADITVALTEPELRLKHAMLDCFASQCTVLAPFYALAAERFRQAPAYDFTQPPHRGALLYEQNRFPLSGDTWRRTAEQALYALDLAHVPADEDRAGAGVARRAARSAS